MSEPVLRGGHKWAFNRLYEYVEYKAEEHGIAVEQVDPKNTSQRCTHCGFTIQTTATTTTLCVRSVGTRTTLTTTPRRTSACEISVATKLGATEAHPWACA